MRWGLTPGNGGVTTARDWDCGYARPHGADAVTRLPPSPIRSRAPSGSFLRTRTDTEPPEGYFRSAASFCFATPDVFRENLYRPIFQAARGDRLPASLDPAGHLALYVLYIARRCSSSWFGISDDRFPDPIFLAPLLLGVTNRTKSFHAGRKGQPLLQPYRDLAKLFARGRSIAGRPTPRSFAGVHSSASPPWWAALALVPFAEAPRFIASRATSCFWSTSRPRAISPRPRCARHRLELRGMGASRECSSQPSRSAAPARACRQWPCATGTSFTLRNAGTVSGGVWSSAGPPCPRGGRALVVFLAETRGSLRRPQHASRADHDSRGDGSRPRGPDLALIRDRLRDQECGSWIDRRRDPVPVRNRRVLPTWHVLAG